MLGFSRNKIEETPFNKAMEEKTEEERIETFKKMGKISYQNTILRAQEMLSEEEKEELDETAGGSDPEKKIFNYLQEKIPNFSEIIKEEVEKTQNLIEENMTNEKKQNDNETEPESDDVNIENLNKMGEISLKRISTEILNTTEGEEKKAFEDILETGDEDKVISYIENNYPELNRKISAETASDVDYLKSKLRAKFAEMRKNENKEE
ncbi:hypothetical protein K9M50_00360 [Patescibacteria group bacterium]|nr:hypothetical protein [Patescibacteria group bacterium]